MEKKIQITQMPKISADEIHTGIIVENKKQKDDVPKSLTLYVVFSILVLIIFTLTEFIVSTVSGISHDTLTTCFFACFGGEILCCALIKIFKLKREDSEV